MRVLKGRVAVVTGGASGIGRAMVDRFVAEGMKVVVADVESNALDRTVEEVRAGGASVTGAVTDVSDVSAVQRLATTTMDTFGAVHVLCNNAGVETGGAFADIPLSAWRWVLDVNLFGVIHGCQVFLPLIRQQEEGHIVNTASVVAFQTGLPTMAPYTASKCAVLGLTENLALELRESAPHVNVSVLVPGWTRTRMAEAERNRPRDLRSSLEDPVRKAVIAEMAKLMDTEGMEPAEVADVVISALLTNEFYVLTHPDVATAGMQQRGRWMRDGTMPEVPVAG